LTKYFLTAPTCVGRASSSPSIVVRVIAHEPSSLGIHLPLESGWKDNVFFSTRFLEIHWDEPSCWKFVLTSLDIVVQDGHVFKFKQAWISTGLLSTGTSTTSMLYTEGRKGAASVEMCIEMRYLCEAIVTSYASLCKWLPSSG